MKLFKVIAVVCLTVAVTKATPVPQNHNDAVTDSLRNDQFPLSIPESDKVKPSIYEENNDRQLKQISMSSLIGDLEQGLFASALSVNKVLTDKNVNIPEIKPIEHGIQHDVNKRHSVAQEDAESTTRAALTETITSEVPITHNVLLQTTEKVPEGNGKPAHIVIDRIAIQPHTGGIAFIPTFELKRTVNGDDQIKDHEIAKITISKTEITGLANLTSSKVEEISSTMTAATTESLLNSETTTNDATTLETTTIMDSSSTTNTTTTTSITASTPLTTASSSSTESIVLEVSTSTTPKNIEQLKEAEEELKEKVAEIEAEPIILSARV